jgi:hypothetical protein
VLRKLNKGGREKRHTIFKTLKNRTMLKADCYEIDEYESSERKEGRK